MEFGIATYGLAYVAGVLSTLSPCVLPLVPILIATAVAAHRLGAYALALGLMISFSAVGIFVATAGASLGLDQAVFRNIAAVILIMFGILLLSVKLQERFATATSGLSAAGDNVLARINLDGLKGQFVIGLVLVRNHLESLCRTHTRRSDNLGVARPESGTDCTVDGGC